MKRYFKRLLALVVFIMLVIGFFCVVSLLLLKPNSDFEKTAAVAGIAYFLWLIAEMFDFFVQEDK